MKIQGAVLEASGADRPYADSRPLTVREVDLAEPGETELLVRIEAAGVCHSDLSVVNGSRPRPLPMLLGHEAAGIVEHVGQAVTDVSVGQRVVMTFLPRCGSCANCRTGGRLPCTPGSAANAAGSLLASPGRLSIAGTPIHHHLGVSAFATHAVVDRRSVVPVPDDVPPEVAAVLGCAVLTGGGAILNVVDPEPGESVMIVGLGGVGMGALLSALAIGVTDVIAVDTNEDKLALARDWGATRACHPDEVSQGVVASHVLECVGHESAFELAFNATEPGGRTVTVGLPSPQAVAQLSPLAITAEARTVIGSYMGSSVPQRDIPKFVQLWREGRLPLERLVTARIGLDELNEAMDALADGQAVRQVVTFP